MHTIEISHWPPGCKKVSHIRPIQKHAGLSLSQAKAITDAVLDGSTPRVHLSSEAAARSVILELRDIGSVANLVEVHSA